MPILAGDVLRAAQPWQPLGRLLVEKGLLSEAELEAALAEQPRSGRRLGEILLEHGWICRPSLTRALAEQSGVELEEEHGFGTGLRAEIERRHLRKRRLRARLDPPPAPPRRREPLEDEGSWAPAAEEGARLARPGMR